MIHADVIRHKINSLTYNRRLQYRENIGYNYEQHTRNKPPAIFVQEFIKVSEVFHTAVVRKSERPKVRKSKIGNKSEITAA